MAMLSAPEAAQQMGVSLRRVYAMINAGDLDAQRIGQHWVIDAASLPQQRRHAGRPMSQRIVWAMLASDGAVDDVDWIGADEAYRLRRRIDRLCSDPEPIDRLRSWAASRGEVLHLSAQDPAQVREDDRFVVSGVSDPRAGISAAAFAEGYVHRDDAQGLVADHLLVPAARARADVVLRVSPLPLSAPVPLLVVIADLADSGGPRERKRAEELLSLWACGRGNAASASVRRPLRDAVQPEPLGSCPR
ncbi:helix-turn-helix domain-containing protein [Cellulomonas wangsupingiae]|uniref:helix-turn-helix domain-containing protein n=1 Tax=Cellulomonas wangsupingiae TaxID=2968085 RepID=UPI001D0EBF3D|nr:helix-turn-helix domain-containing protein [Cellulomonas wangsupingiae]MCM0638159.1 helix-turn-helix domain-containing protein [Cellulomonas wangsupingiae]